MGDYFFKDNRSGFWKYKTKEGYDSFYKETSRDYDRGTDQNGNPYYIKYNKSENPYYIKLNKYGNPYYIKYNKEDNSKSFEVYPVEDDLYQDRYGNVLPVEWGKYYDPKETWLPTVEVTPKTGTLILDTYYPLSEEYPYTGHSELQIEPDYDEHISNYRLVSKSSSDDDYNLVTNNCADATRKVLETLFNKKMNPWFFTTPGDSRDFLIENGGTEMKDGSVKFKLSEEQLLKLKDFIDKLNA